MYKHFPILDLAVKYVMVNHGHHVNNHGSTHGRSAIHTKFQGYQLIGSGKEDIKRVYHIWAWRPLWSCDLNELNIFSFSSNPGGYI